jgi:hypothetical protein
MPDNAKVLHLFLRDTLVGTIEPRGHADSWSYGHFTPCDAFGEFATLFGEWSLLMHADETDPRLSRAASDELRQVEFAIDQLRARLYIPARDRWVRVTQLNIDGSLIEWKADG